MLCCLQWWCQHEPKVLSKKELKKGVKCPLRKQPFSEDLNGKDGAEKAARFLRWYVIEGHAGYEVSTLAPNQWQQHALLLLLLPLPPECPFECPCRERRLACTRRTAPSSACMQLWPR